MIRDKARNIEEGEKISKYFLALEKSHTIKKSIHQLKRSDEKIVRDKEDILQELHNYYEELYSESNTDDINRDTNMFLTDNHETLTEFEQSLCEGSVTESECLKALRSMTNNKTPGIDGFPAEFYKFFWTYKRSCIS